MNDGAMHRSFVCCCCDDCDEFFLACKNICTVIENPSKTLIAKKRSVNICAKNYLLDCLVFLKNGLLMKGFPFGTFRSLKRYAVG